MSDFENFTGMLVRRGFRVDIREGSVGENHFNVVSLECDTDGPGSPRIATKLWFKVPGGDFDMATQQYYDPPPPWPIASRSWTEAA